MIDHLLLVGCGRMGGALARGWLNRDAARHLTIVEPEAALAAPLLGDGRVRHVTGLAALAGAGPADAMVLAIKPQMVAALGPDLAPLAPAGGLVLSILAGTRIATLAGFCARSAIVRVMPNLPAAIGQGASVAVAGPGVTAAHRQQADGLMAAVGSVDWVDDEGLLDPVTAVSGSGPAYFFLLIEALAGAARAAGLPDELAESLSRRTLIGAARLAEEDERPAAALRQAVTSPGGTTAAALAVLMGDDGLAPLLARAVAAATDRSRALGG